MGRRRTWGRSCQCSSAVAGGDHSARTAVVLDLVVEPLDLAVSHPVFVPAFLMDYDIAAGSVRGNLVVASQRPDNGANRSRLDLRRSSGWEW